MCADLVLLGGGHANLPLIQQIPEILERGHRVTCVSLAPVHYYSGMGPGMLGGAYKPEEIRFPVRAMVQSAGAAFVEEACVRINAAARTISLESGRELGFDVLSVNTGSSIASTLRIAPEVESGTAGPRLFRVKPIEQLLQLRHFFENELKKRALRIAVVGGGPAAVEVAANLMRIVRETDGANRDGTEIHLIAGRAVLPGFPRIAERSVLKALSSLGIRVSPDSRVESLGPDGLVIDGRTEFIDVAVLATGVVPSPIFRDSGLPTGDDGSLAVNESLHMLGNHTVFGGGDCIWFTPRPLPRAGVFAVREGPILIHNVMETLDKGPRARLRTFSPQKEYLLLLNLGDDTALFWRRFAGLHVVYRNAGVYRLKDRIDMTFMHRFGSEADREVQPA